MGVLAGVGGFREGAVALIQRDGGDGLPPPLLPPDVVDTQIGGQAIDPGGKAALPLKIGQGLPGLEKGLLGQVGALLPVPGDAKGQGIHPVLILLHQLGKRLMVPRFCPPDQLLVVLLCHHVTFFQLGVKRDK